MKQLTKYTRYLLLIILLFLSLTPLIWFIGRGDVLINGVDTNFPLDPWVWLKRRFFVWNGVANAGADFSSSTAGLFFHLIQVIPFKLGFGLQQVQIISLVFWFVLIIFSAYLFARIILPRKALSQLLFVVFYSFNIYLFNSWENVKVANLSLIAALPLALSLLVLLREKRLSFSKAGFYSVLLGIVVSGTGINPSYFISFFLILLVFELALILVDLRRKSVWERLKEFLFVGLLIVLVNAFWLSPTVNFILKSVPAQESITTIGFTGWIDSLSENTSLLNILRLQGAWDWYTFDEVTGLPLYIPYALNYFYRLPFIVFSFLIPVIAFLSFLFRERKKNYLYLAFSLMLILGVFLGTGTHPPTGNLFVWLTKHVPFFSLFRSPWYIFTPLVSLAYTGLISLLFWKLDSSLEQPKLFFVRLVVSGFLLILIIGNFLYSYPLITGKIFRPGRHDSFYVEFPSYIFDTQKWLSKRGDGRIIGYPDEEIQEFSWGYRGTESILELFSEHEVLFPPLNAPDAPVAKIIKQFYQCLKKGQIDSAKSLAAKLNLKTIFEKGDQKSFALDFPEAIKNLPVERFGEWGFYRLPEDRDKNRGLYAAEEILYATPYYEAQKLISTTGLNSVIVNPEDTIVQKIPNIGRLKGHAIIAYNSQVQELSNYISWEDKIRRRLKDREISKVDYSFDVFEEGGYRPILERYQIEDFGINVTDSFTVNLDGEEVVWEVDRITDSNIYFRSIKLEKGNHVVSINLNNKNLIPSGDFNSNELYEVSDSGEIKIDTSLAGNKYLSIFDMNEPGVYTKFKVLDYDPTRRYLIKFRCKYFFGNAAEVVFGQDKNNTIVKTEVERIPVHHEWQDYSLYYVSVQTESDMTINLVPTRRKDNPFGSKILFDDVGVYKVFDNNLIFLNEGKTKFSMPIIKYKQISPVFYEGEVNGARGPGIIVFAENYSPEWQLLATTLDNKKLEFEPLHFSANLYSNAWYIEGAPEEYRIRIYYRPQRIFQAGLVVSAITLVISSLFYFSDIKRRRNV